METQRPSALEGACRELMCSSRSCQAARLEGAGQVPGLRGVSMMPCDTQPSSAAAQWPDGRPHWVSDVPPSERRSRGCVPSVPLGHMQLWDRRGWESVSKCFLPEPNASSCLLRCDPGMREDGERGGQQFLSRPVTVHLEAGLISPGRDPSPNHEQKALGQ